MTRAALPERLAQPPAAGLQWGASVFLSLYFVAMCFTVLVRPEVGSALAPLLGPWAGHVYGHAGCTMAAALPVASRVVLGVLPVVALVAFLGRRRRLLALPFLLWYLAWALFAWASAVNSTS